MARLVIYFIILCVTFFGCTFQPDGDELTGVPIPEPTATIMNFFESQDVLLVRGVFYTVLTPRSTEQVVGYRFLFDDVEVGKAPESPYSISLDTRKYTDGIHTVNLELTKLRDSQSIAAQAGLDTYTQTFSRKIETFNKIITAPTVTTSIDDGVLTLHWQPYAGYRFVKYSIASSDLYIGKEITDQNQTSLKVPQYISGKARFDFSLSIFDHEEYKTSVNYEMPYEVNIEKTVAGMKFTWPQSPFSSCTGYKITLDQNGQKTEQTFPNTAGSVEIPGSFVFPFEMTGTIEATHDDNSFVQNVLKIKKVSTLQPVGGSSPDHNDFQQFIPHPANDSLLIIKYVPDSYGAGRCAVYNRNTGAEITTVYGYTTVSPNGKYIYRYNETADLVRLNPTDLSETTDKVSYQSITGVRQYSKIRISNDNKLLFAANGRYIGYNWDTRQTIFNTTAVSGKFVSDDGELAPGGKTYYNLFGRQVIALDQDPNTSYNVSQIEYTLMVPHMEKAIRLSGRRLSVHTLPALTELYFANAVNNLNNEVLIFTNQDDRFGVVYIVNNVMKIDFFDVRDLSLLASIDTSLDITKAAGYQFSLVGNELFVFLGGNYDQGPLHHLKLPF